MTTMQIFYPDGSITQKLPPPIPRWDVVQMIWCPVCKQKADVTITPSTSQRLRQPLYIARCAKCRVCLKGMDTKDMVRHDLLQPEPKRTGKKKKQPPPVPHKEHKHRKFRKPRNRHVKKAVPQPPPIPDPSYADMPYPQYLLTEHWRKTRSEAILRAGSKCQVCSRPKKLEAHHRTYDRVGHERPEDVTVLCSECHDLFHNNSRLKR